MPELKHWTASGVDEFLYRIGFDFVRQIEQALEDAGVSQADLAKVLGVTEGRVSQVLNNPGNLTLRKMIEYARALDRKVSVIAYDDGDPKNQNGPIPAEVFVSCWDHAGKPADFFAMREPQTAADTGFLIHPMPIPTQDSTPVSLDLSRSVSETEETATNPPEVYQWQN